MKNPLYAFEERHIGVHNEENVGAEGLYDVLNEYLREIGEEKLPEKLWEALEEGNEAEFYELAKQAVDTLQEVTDPDLGWILDGYALLLVVPQPEDGEIEAYEEILVANPRGLPLWKQKIAKEMFKPATGLTFSQFRNRLRRKGHQDKSDQWFEMVLKDLMDYGLVVISGATAQKPAQYMSIYGMTIDEFRKLFSETIWEPGNRFVLRLEEYVRPMQIVGTPDDSSLIGKWVRLRPEGIRHAGMDLIMPLRVAYENFSALYPGLSADKVTNIYTKRHSYVPQ